MQTQKRGMLSSSDAEKTARIFRALTDESRLRIVHLLMTEKRICVTDIAEMLGQSISSVSHHLRKLRDLGFIKREREGKRIFHSLDDECIDDIMRRAIEHVRGK